MSNYPVLTNPLNSYAAALQILIYSKMEDMLLVNIETVKMRTLNVLFADIITYHLTLRFWV